MSISIEHKAFEGRDGAMQDIRACGTWPTTFVSGKSDGLELHWHDHDVIAYVIEGETSFFDAEQDKHLPITAGDKVLIPRGTVHAEGPVAERIVYLLATPDALKSRDFLRLQDPATAPSQN
ncbi:MAG: cupin domain-containing protein [Pseudomonadaceae bacterium]|nr:cupin domain-containing protein [Pseudomonadaceae bacterium]